MTRTVEDLHPGDQVLWDAAMAGHADSFGQLFDRYQHRIYTYCFRRCGSWSDAEDLVATVFLEAWRTRRRMQLQDGSILPWLYGVATNVTSKHQRSTVRYHAALDRLAAHRDAVGAHTDEVDRLADEQQMQKVLVAFARIPEREREVLALAYFAELDYAAVSAALGVPIGTVRSRISRGKARLRDLIDLDDVPTGLGEGLL